MRGCGTTSLLSENTIRNGQQVAFATDVIDLMDALEIRKVALAGFDWDELCNDDFVIFEVKPTHSNS